MFKVDISLSIDCRGVSSGDLKSIRFSELGWGGGGSNVEAEGLGQPFTLPPGEVDDWRDEPGLPAVEDWGDWNAPVCFLFFHFPLCLRPLFGWWPAVMTGWVNPFILFVQSYPHEVPVLLPSTSSLTPSMFSPFQPVVTEGDPFQWLQLLKMTTTIDIAGTS